MSASSSEKGRFQGILAMVVKKLRAWSCQILQVFKYMGLILFLIGTVHSSAQAQNRKELEARRKNLLKEIEQTSSMLKDTRQNQKATLNRYTTLQKQIGKRQELIATLREEIFLAEDQINRAKEVVDALSVDVDILKKEYAEMARVAYRQKLKNNYLLFLLSSDSFNEAFRRWNYLKQYDAYRQKQARLILDTQDMLENKVSNIEQKKADKEDLLQSEMIQKGILEQELYDSDNLLAKLKADESRLQNDLVKKERVSAQLSEAIQKIILAEIERKKKEDEARAMAEAEKKKQKENAKKEVPKVNTSPLSAGFSSNKGKLPWPVAGGVITRKFGKQAHPILKSIQITNNGIDIQTPKSAEVKSVFEGKVLGMQFIPGNNYMVILQHGKYFTVYSNLEEVLVKRGDKIATKQALGKVGLDKISGHYELHFEVWEDKNLENPSRWLSR